MPLCQALDITHPKKDKGIISPSNFLRFSPFNCLNAVLLFDKGDYPENSYIVLCSNKQRHFEHVTDVLN